MLDTTTLNISLEKNYAIVQIDNGKVNAINTPLLKELKQTFTSLDQNESIKGAILSGRPHVFSGGLDVVFLAGLDEAGLLDFWVSYMEAMQAMVSFSKPLIGALTGYGPAGGTILALCTDYRIMGKGPKHVVGMHEFKLNMQIPEMLCDVYAYYLGEVKAWKAIQQAKLYTSEEAVEVGLVDESVEVEEVLTRAEQYLKRQINVYPKVFSKSKQFFRKGLHKIVMERDVPALAQQAVTFNSDPVLQGMVKAFVASLKKK